MWKQRPRGEEERRRGFGRRRSTERESGVFLTNLTGSPDTSLKDRYPRPLTSLGGGARGGGGEVCPSYGPPEKRPLTTIRPEDRDSLLLDPVLYIVVLSSSVVTFIVFT